MTWVYPRVRGGTISTDALADDMDGLSPRARGNRQGLQDEIKPERSIPACAGEPVSPAICRALSTVYPRVRGGTGGRPATSASYSGLSPRARGNPWRPGRQSHQRRSIPACAGEPRGACRTTRFHRVYPRVRGGTVAPSQTSLIGQGLSPRARGNHPHGKLGRESQRSIPACAGEPVRAGRKRY